MLVPRTVSERHVFFRIKHLLSSLLLCVCVCAFEDKGGVATCHSKENTNLPSKIDMIRFDQLGDTTKLYDKIDHIISYPIKSTSIFQRVLFEP